MEIRGKELYQSQLRKYANISIEWKSLSDKTIVITGAAGMIGTFLIDVLMYRNEVFHENIHIIAVGRDKQKTKERLGVHWDKEEFVFLQQDVNKPFQKDKILNNIDYIIHGASNTHPVQYANDPIGTIETNVMGTKNLLELTSQQKNCRFVFLSSVEIYGENRGDTEQFTEDYCGYIDCNTLRACYTESKRLGETLCQAYIASLKINAVIPRLCRVYGPTMSPSDSKVIAQFIKKAVAGEDIVLKSKGMQRYSFVYVADAISAILTIMLKGNRGEVYNIADENSDYYLKDLAELLAGLSGKKVIYELPDENERKGYSTATKALLNAQKLKALGWRCEYNMQEGLKQTYEILRPFV